MYLREGRVVGHRRKHSAWTVPSSRGTINLSAQARHKTYGNGQSSSPRDATLLSTYVVRTALAFADFTLCCIEQRKYWFWELSTWETHQLFRKYDLSFRGEEKKKKGGLPSVTWGRSASELSYICSVRTPGSQSNIMNSKLSQTTAYETQNYYGLYRYFGIPDPEQAVVLYERALPTRDSLVGWQN